MKKNWILRLGVLAMVLTLVTMPMVSSTYAKYVTSATGTDTARVAKWGVTVTANPTGAFGDAYEAVADGNEAVDYATAGVTVKSTADNTDVLAPGTQGSFTFTVAGTPEVKVALAFDATVTLTGWTIEDWEEADQVYEPINWTLYNGTNYWDGDGFDSETAVNLTGAALDSAIDGLDSTNNPLTVLNKTYTVAWVWPFFVDDDTVIEKADGVVYTFDEADTILGNYASAPTLSITVTVTATQID
jgi:hypothetical protein